MEGFTGRKGLIAPEALRALHRRSDLRGGLQMASHLGAIGLSGLLLQMTWGSAWAIPVFLVHGVLINFLYAAQHELSHSTVFATRRLNEVFGRLVGFLMLYPRDFDQQQHFAHHRYTQDWARDGELERPRYTLASYLNWLVGPDYWYTRIRRILRYAAGSVPEGYLAERDKPGLVREARWHLAGYLAIAGVSLALQSWAAVIFWLAPMLVTKPVHQLQNSMEHLGLTHAPDTLANTRTTRTNALMRWLCWNMQYHTAHHTFPAVPFHRLPELHRRIVARIGHEPPTMTYLGFQRAVLARLAGGKSEADYSDEESWILDPSQAAPVPAGEAARA